MSGGNEHCDRIGPSIEDELASIVADVPQAEWDRHPADLTDRLDDCLHVVLVRKKPGA